jgi:hypothetical protein
MMNVEPDLSCLEQPPGFTLVNNDGNSIALWILYQPGPRKYGDPLLFASV